MPFSTSYLPKSWATRSSRDSSQPHRAYPDLPSSEKNKGGYLRRERAGREVVGVCLGDSSGYFFRIFFLSLTQLVGCRDGSTLIVEREVCA